MGLFTAFGKYVLRTSNNKITKHAAKKAKKQAYEDTNKDIKKAKRQGKHINGKRTYKKNLDKRMQTVEEQDKLRNKFIDDL